MNKNNTNSSGSSTDNKEKKHSTIKVVFTSVIFTLIVIILILLLTLLGLKKCSSSNNNTNNGDSINKEQNNKITDIFKNIVNKEMTFDGFDNDELKDVIAVTYNDNYPTSFNLNIVIDSGTKVYYYSADEVNYLGNKNDYDNFLSYLLKEDNNHQLNGNVSLSLLDKTNEAINTSKTIYKAVISKNTSNEKYLSGFCYEDNNFFIYQKTPMNDDIDPFSDIEDQKISSGSPLYNYYQGLLDS